MIVFTTLTSDGTMLMLSSKNVALRIQNCTETHLSLDLKENKETKFKFVWNCSI